MRLLEAAALCALVCGAAKALDPGLDDTGPAQLSAQLRQFDALVTPRDVQGKINTAGVGGDANSTWRCGAGSAAERRLGAAARLCHSSGCSNCSPSARRHARLFPTVQRLSTPAGRHTLTPKRRAGLPAATAAPTTNSH